MKEQADAVDAAFQKRVIEVDNAKLALEDNLRKVSIGLLRSTYKRCFNALVIASERFVLSFHPSSTRLQQLFNLYVSRRASQLIIVKQV